jgi:acetoin utilization deacetylase AcuC-like enzyme
VLYTSTHQFPFYPGTGAASERGRGAGVGATINVPLGAGAGDVEIVRAYREVIVPAIDRFAPDAVLISAGFDAHRDDPLAGLEVTEAGYGALTTLVREVADRVCEGRIVSLLEGGYDLRALGASVEAHLTALDVP